MKMKLSYRFKFFIAVHGYRALIKSAFKYDFYRG